MSKSKMWSLLAGVMVLSLILAACAAPQQIEVPVTVVVKETQVQEVKVVETVQVEVEATTIVEVEREAFTTPHPILGDLKVRQALAYCTDKAAIANAGYPLLTREQAEGLVLNTFIRQGHWAYAGDENITIYDFDPAKGAALLDEAGWTLAEGATFRANANGDELSLKFTTTSAAFRQAWGAVFERQMVGCGIRIVRLHAPASWWFGDTTGLARRDFELGAFAWVGQFDPGSQTLFACDQIPSPANNWEGQNYMGWCNEAASNGIKKANNTLVQEERVEAYRIVQQEFTKDVPSIPLFNRTETFSTRADMVGFAPAPGQEYYFYNVGEWEVPDSDTIVFGFTQEPASLFTLVEDAFVANLAVYLIRPGAEIYPNYVPEAVYVKQLATLESGLAQNNDVEVKEGDMVADADGNVVALAAGVKVINAAGETVEFTGGTVMLKQLSMKYEYVDGIKWSDGEPLKGADFELGHKISCDRESGATSFIVCDKTANVEFTDTPVGYTHTYIPGVQDPTYYFALWAAYPSHRVLADGRMLKDVPAKEWATLPEIAENPIGYGPYMLTEWVKGEKLVYTANPYWVFGAPKTPNFVIKFVTPENAEAQLLTGEVDALGSETLAGLTETLVKAEAEGKVKNYVIPGGTWEHIDLALFVK